MGQAFVPMPVLHAEATLLRTPLNAAGVMLRLFQNDYVPIPGDTVLNTDFVEADYTGYAAVDLEDEWSDFTEILPGVLEMQTDEYLFARDAGAGTDNTVYGWYVESSGNAILMVQRFDNPIPMSEVDPRFRLRLKYQHQSPPNCA